MGNKLNDTSSKGAYINLGTYAPMWDTKVNSPEIAGLLYKTINIFSSSYNKNFINDINEN